MYFIRRCLHLGPLLLTNLGPSLRRIAVDASLPVCMSEMMNEKRDHDGLAPFSCFSVSDRCTSFSVLPMFRPQAAGCVCGTRTTVLARDV
jgi:hypothetical protein